MYFGAPDHFVPTDLPGCALWLRADLGVTISAGKIAAWNDQSGNGNNFSAAGAAQPTYNTAPLNGRPTARFDGVANAMTCANNIAVGAPSCMVAVLVPRTIDASTHGLLVAKFIAMYTVVDASSHWGVYFNAAVVDGVLSAGTSYALIANQHNTNNVDLITNGTLTNQTNGTGTPSRTGTTLGSDPTGIQFCNMDLAELALYSRDLQADELVRIRDYFANEYGFAA